MAHILHIDSSPRGERSISRAVTNDFITTWKQAYIDQIIRVGRTFAVNEQGFQGLVDSSKKMLVITARGGSYQQGTPAATYDLQEPYIRAVFGFIGITDIKFIHVDNLTAAPDESLEKADKAVEEIIASW